MHKQHRKYSSNALDADGLEALNGLAYLSIALIYFFIDQKHISVGAGLPAIPDNLGGQTHRLAGKPAPTGSLRC
jgi:hypothetical protein